MKRSIVMVFVLATMSLGMSGCYVEPESGEEGDVRVGSPGAEEQSLTQCPGGSFTACYTACRNACVTEGLCSSLSDPSPACKQCKQECFNDCHALCD